MEAQANVKGQEVEIEPDVDEEDFIESLYANNLVDGPGEKSTIFTQERYDSILQATQRAQEIGFKNKKSSEEARRYKRFRIITIDKKSRLILRINENDKKKFVRYVVTVEDVYKTVKAIHVTSGHAGVRVMKRAADKLYANLSETVLDLYKKMCIACKKKEKGVLKQHIVVKPILTKSFQHRGQLDLIDFQARSDGIYKYVAVFTDHGIKYTQYRALPDKKASTVVPQAVSMMSTFGPPCILHTDNGGEFKNHEMGEAILREWPSVRFVHGTARHSETQGGVERVNQDTTQLILSAMHDSKRKDWSNLLPFIQHTINNRYQSTIRCTPLEAATGRQSFLGLYSMGFPRDVVENMKTEQDLKDYLKTIREDGLSETEDEDSDNQETEYGPTYDEVQRHDEESARDFAVDPEVMKHLEKVNVAASKTSWCQKGKATILNCKASKKVRIENENALEESTKGGNSSETKRQKKVRSNGSQTTKCVTTDVNKKGQVPDRTSTTELSSINENNVNQGEVTFVEAADSSLQAAVSETDTVKDDGETESAPVTKEKTNGTKSGLKVPTKKRKKKQLVILNTHQELVLAERSKEKPNVNKIDEIVFSSPTNENDIEHMDCAEKNECSKKKKISGKKRKSASPVRIVNKPPHKKTKKKSSKNTQVNDDSCCPNPKGSKKRKRVPGMESVENVDSSFDESSEDDHYQEDVQAVIDDLNARIRQSSRIAIRKTQGKVATHVPETKRIQSRKKLFGDCCKCDVKTSEKCTNCSRYMHQNKSCAIEYAPDNPNRLKVYLCYSCHAEAQHKRSVYIASKIVDNSHVAEGPCIACKRKTSCKCAGLCGNFVHLTSKCAFRSTKQNTKQAFGLCSLCSARENADEKRQGAVLGIRKQAKVMLDRSKAKFPPLKTNTPVQIAIPKEDRSTLSDRNLLGVILDEPFNGEYRVGTKDGILKRYVSRPNLKQMCIRTVESCDVPNVHLSLRKSAAIVNLTGGKGFIRCSCKTMCKTNSCSCVKGKYKCSSNCHHSTSCCNKA